MILIPMAGLSRRFSAAGYKVPKYELEAHGRTLFYWSVWSFRRYFADELFVFVSRRASNARAFIERQCESLGVENFLVVELDCDTRGQAETVHLGVEALGDRLTDDEALLVFNIDTIRPNYQFPDGLQFADAYLETFPGEGDAWSFAKTAAAFSTRVIQTSEKRRISSDCSTGLYYFSSIRLFKDAFLEISGGGCGSFMAEWKELYIAPMFNMIIRSGASVHVHRISRSEVIFSGVPDEYVEICASSSPLLSFQRA